MVMHGLRAVVAGAQKALPPAKVPKALQGVGPLAKRVHGELAKARLGTKAPKPVKKAPMIPPVKKDPRGVIAPLFADPDPVITFGGGDDSVKNEVVQNAPTAPGLGSGPVRSLGGGGGGTLGLCDQVHNWVADGTLTAEAARLRYGQCFD
jgi:hypothetical protein